MQRKAGIVSIATIVLTGALALVIPPTAPTLAIADDRPGQFDVIHETPDADLGEVSRIRQVYRPTGHTASLSVEYDDGTIEMTEYNFNSGERANHRRFVKPDAPGPRYLERESLFDANGKWLREFYYRPDGTKQFMDEPGQEEYTKVRTIYDLDGKTVVRRVLLEG